MFKKTLVHQNANLFKKNNLIIVQSKKLILFLTRLIKLRLFVFFVLKILSFIVKNNKVYIIQLQKT